MSFTDQILSGLKQQFRFRKVKGAWLQEGQCPSCQKWEAFCAADDPKIVRCGRQENCGWEDSVRNLLPDLFEDWSKRFIVTEERPNASADAYLEFERGLDLKLLAGSYTQETYQDPGTRATSATVRFRVGDTYWERLIDRVGRFEKKAHFRPGGSWKGHVWMPPSTTIERLAQADEILLAEGIFDATALTQAGHLAVSTMSVNVWPEIFLGQLRKELERIGRVTRPRLVFAFDVGRAGTEWTRKFVDKAEEQGWEAAAMQVRPDGEGSKLDWNDLWLRHKAWKGDPDKAPMSTAAFEEYLYNGAITIAKTPREKAKLIANRLLLSSFDFRHGNRLWWARVKYDEDKNRTIEVDEIANCAFRLLYRERDEISDETNYFLQVDFPYSQPSVKARFSASACANSGEFKKRLMAFAGMWSGTGEQLDRLMRNQTRQLKVVEPIYFTGYSHPHRAWLLGDMAVREGRVVTINREAYFDFGKAAVKPRSAERLLDINYDPERLDFSWVNDIWTAWGPRSLVGLGFFIMSLFAVQIRLREKSLGFLEITGEPGSGKSTLIEFLWKLCGRADYEGFDPNKATPAFIARSLIKVSNLPVGLVEGKRDDEKRGGYRQFDYNDLLVLFNGRSPRGTGQKSNGYETNEPPFLGTIYLVQNDRIDAIPAVLERLMSMRIDKEGRTDATREAATRIEQWPLEDASGTIVHALRKEAAWLEYYFQRSAFHQADLRERVEGLHNDRIIKNHGQLCAAIETLPRLFPDCRKEWVEETIRFVDAMALDRQLSTGGDHPKVATFWERYNWLLDREADTAHVQGLSLNQSRDPANYIAVNLVEFESRCRSNGLGTPDMDELKKLLRGSKSRKFIGASRSVNNPVNKSVRCWVFHQPAKDPARKDGAR
ncbi:toprim domain-containing protein [Sphingomonas sp.]|uniref:toprim domain-containing protein n=1 Tax=Sphingomonas sp. TaxID=28214 RepID=UPI00307D047A